MARGHRGIAVRALAALLLASCSSTPSPSPTSPAESTGPSPSLSGSPRPSEPPAAAEQAGLLLNEVRFASAGEPASVEVSNTSPGAIDADGAIIRIGSSDLVLDGPLPVPAGDQLLVLLDGLDSVEGSVVHVGPGFELGPDRGAIELVDRGGARLDRVAWGTAEPGAVAAGPGGIVAAAFAAGTGIGRVPGATRPGAPEEWVVYPAADATAGGTNPVPAVSILLPLSGAILDRSGADLFWYPVPGAATYRVQVDSDPTFGSPVLDTTVTEPQLRVASLGLGAFVWRVQAIAADGTPSRFSEPADVELASGIALAADTPGKHLAVPALAQRKDTAMLLLEHNKETGPHAWDADHGTTGPGDLADKMNCAIAMVAMISAFYGGRLSQDRIGYEILQRRAGNPAGPEGDLMYGSGISGLEASEAFRFAVGGVTEGGLMTFDDMWNTIVQEIDAGRPVAGANSHHGFVVTGYEVTGGRRLISMNDPWAARTYKVDIDHSKAPPSDFNLWLMPASPNVRHQEPSVTQDSDGDGVVDFDETERFKTNASDKDSDGDALPDKQDIASGVFDPKYGYATNPGGQFGRDFDSDGNPTERDKDSDEGGCLDGDEDADRNGHRNGSETWNFDPDDDSCSGWRGTMSITRKWTYSGGAQTGTATTTFDGVWVADTNTQHYDLICGPSRGPDCPQIFLATGTITWSFQAQCHDRSDSGAGTFEAGTGFVVPDFDWDQQALYLRQTADGTKLQYWGQGVMVGKTDQGEPYCTAGPGLADAERYFFEILEDAADRQPYPGTIQSCIGRTWEIGIDDTVISGSCRNKSVAGETDSTWTWNLTKVGKPGGG